MIEIENTYNKKLQVFKMTEVITKQVKKKKKVIIGKISQKKENIASRSDLETIGLGKLKANNPQKTYNF